MTHIILFLTSFLGQSGFSSSPTDFQLFEMTPTEWPIAAPHLEHVDPPIVAHVAEVIPVRRRVYVYSKETKAHLKARKGSCIWCIKCFHDSLKPEIADDFDFQFGTNIPSDWKGGTPLVTWEDCNGLWVRQDGWQGVRPFLDAWQKSQLTHRSVAAVPKAVKSQSARINVYQVPINGKYPPPEGLLRRHLSGAPHHVNTAGMSYDEMLYLHNLEHTPH